MGVLVFSSGAIVVPGRAQAPPVPVAQSQSVITAPGTTPLLQAPLTQPPLPVDGATRPPLPTAQPTQPPLKEYQPKEDNSTATLEAVEWYDRLALKGMHFLKEALYVGMFALFCILMYAFRDTWATPIFEATCGKVHPPSVRNIPPVGFCCSFCTCCVPKFHPSFRLRIAILSASHLRRTDMMGAMQVYVAIKCGINPMKYTSMVMLHNQFMDTTALWNESIDLTVATADSTITLQILDYDAAGADDVVGTLVLNVSEFFPKLQIGSSGQPLSGCCSCVGPYRMPAETLYLKDLTQKLSFDSKDAGRMKLHLFATRLDKFLPPIMPGMMTDQFKQYQPLVEKM